MNSIAHVLQSFDVNLTKQTKKAKLVQVDVGLAQRAICSFTGSICDVKEGKNFTTDKIPQPLLYQSGPKQVLVGLGPAQGGPILGPLMAFKQHLAVTLSDIY